jgi:hypothetical protein
MTSTTPGIDRSDRRPARPKCPCVELNQVFLALGRRYDRRVLRSPAPVDAIANELAAGGH